MKPIPRRPPMPTRPPSPRRIDKGDDNPDIVAWVIYGCLAVLIVALFFIAEVTGG